MWAKIINEKIKVFVTLPNKYVSEMMNVAGGFDKLPGDIHRQEGFYPLIEPTYNNDTERLGTLYYDDQNQVFTYEVKTCSGYDIAMRSWHEQDFLLRINAPSDLLDTYPSIAIWFQLNGLPIILSDDTASVQLYFNEIKPQHQELFDLLLQAGEIQIENRPEPEDYE